jgi:hypothetical protein
VPAVTKEPEAGQAFFHDPRVLAGGEFLAVALQHDFDMAVSLIMVVAEHLLPGGGHGQIDVPDRFLTAQHAAKKPYLLDLGDGVRIVFVVLDALEEAVEHGSRLGKRRPRAHFGPCDDFPAGVIAGVSRSNNPRSRHSSSTIAPSFLWGNTDLRSSMFAREWVRI